MEIITLSAICAVLLAGSGAAVYHYEKAIRILKDELLVCYADIKSLRNSAASSPGRCRRWQARCNANEKANGDPIGRRKTWVNHEESQQQKNIESRIAQITALAYRVSQQGKHDVFVQYAGHANLLTVQIYLGKWKSELSGNHAWGVWLSSERNRFKMLSQIQTKIRSLLKNSR